MSALNERLRGKRVAAVMTNGSLLQIVAEDGTELTIGWVDESGRPVRGRPMLARHAVQLAGSQELAMPPRRSAAPALIPTL